MIEEYFSIQLSGDHRIALPLANVETVMRLQRQVICPIPEVALFWLGVTHERGSLVWVLDGDLFFELVTESDSPDPNLTAVVLSCWLKETQRRVVLVVKEWLGVSSLYPSELEQASWGLPSQLESLFFSIVITDDKKYGLLNPIAFFEQLSQNSNFN